MAGSNVERFALLITGDGSGAVRELRKVGDTADRELGRATSATEFFSKSFIKMGVGMVAGSAVMAAGLYKTATAAGELELSVGRLEGIFGGASKDVEAFARSANTLGLSDRAATGFAVSIGEAAVGLGIGSEEAARLTPQLIEVVSQLGLLAGMDPAQAMETVNAAMRGEYDSLQRLVPSISQAAIVQAALAETHKKTAAELTSEEKTRAALELIIKKGTATLARSGNVMDSLAGQTAEAKAEFEDLKTGIGAGVVPAVTSLLGGLTDVAGVFTGLSPETQKTAGSMAAVVTAATGLSGAVLVATGGIMKGTKALREFAQVAPIATGAAAGLAAAVVGIGTAMVVIDQLGDAAPDVERFTVAAEAFNGIQLEGELADIFGKDAEKLAELLALFDQAEVKVNEGGIVGGLKKLGSGLSNVFGAGPDVGDMNEATGAMESLDTTLAGLVAGGDLEQAAALLDFLNGVAAESGRSLNTATLTHYADALEDYELSADGAAAAAVKLDGAWLTNRKTALDVATAIDRVGDAQETLADARADAAGTSENAMSAARREADAHRGLEDAYRSSADAAENLRDARQALAEFDGAEAGKLRGLEREQIVRRRVTDAASARQKEIDLLRFDESAGKERERLQEGVADAEDGVASAARRVEDAQRDVADAAKERRDVQVDAAEKIADAERGVEAAALAVAEAYQKALEDGEGNVEVANQWLETLGEVASLLAPGSTIRQGIEAMAAGSTAVKQTKGEAVLWSAAQAGTLNTALLGQIQTGGGPISYDALLRILGDPANTPISAETRTLLKQLGIPGYATGGTVGGPVGRPQLAIVHGGEQITPPGGSGVSIVQNNQFVGGDVPTVTQLDAQNRKLGIRVALSGRRG